MRICVLGNAQAVHIQRWASAYAEHGHEVHVLSIRRSEIPGVTVHPVRLGPLNSTSRLWTLLSYLRLLLAARSRLRRLDPDVLHAHYTITHGVIARFSGFRPRVVSAWGKDVIWDGREPLPRWLVALNRYALAGADRITSTSLYMRGRMRRFVPSLSDVLHVPFGVDTERFHPAAEDETDHSAELLVGFIKTLSPKYAPADLLRAFARVSRQVPTARLVMAGRGPQLGELEDLARELEIADRVRFPGFVSHRQVPRLMRTLDVFVNCSVDPSETFGVVILEAAASGVASVVTDIGGVGEVCRDGETCRMVEPGDPEALAEAILELLRDPEERRRLGHNASRFAERHYRWSENVNTMLEILDGAVEGRRDV